MGLFENKWDSGDSPHIKSLLHYDTNQFFKNNSKIKAHIKVLCCSMSDTRAEMLIPGMIGSWNYYEPLKLNVRVGYDKYFKF
jgi:hypothetical protein